MESFRLKSILDRNWQIILGEKYVCSRDNLHVLSATLFYSLLIHTHNVINSSPTSDRHPRKRTDFILSTASADKKHFE